MIFIKYDKQGKVNFVHYMPFDEKHGMGEIKEELELEGLLVNSILEPLEQEGKKAVMYVNPLTKEIYYEYEDVPTIEDDIIKKEVASLKLENAELMMKSAITDMEIETVKNENSELLFRVANLEMGGSVNV